MDTQSLSRTVLETAWRQQQEGRQTGADLCAALPDEPPAKIAQALISLQSYGLVDLPRPPLLREDSHYTFHVSPAGMRSLASDDDPH